MPEFDSLQARIADASLGPAARLAAADTAVRMDAVLAKPVLIAAAANHDESVEFLVGIGRALARCAEASTHLTEWDCRDMAEAAYDAYDTAP